MFDNWYISIKKAEGDSMGRRVEHIATRCKAKRFGWRYEMMVRKDDENANAVADEDMRQTLGNPCES